MALGARITFSDDEKNPIDLLSFDYNLYVTYDAHLEDKAAGRIDGGEFSLLAYSKKVLKAFDFLTNEKTDLKGSITLGDAKKAGGDMRTIKFEKARITSFSESYSENSPPTMQFTLKAGKVDIDQLPFDFVGRESAGLSQPAEAEQYRLSGRVLLSPADRPGGAGAVQ